MQKSNAFQCGIHRSFKKYTRQHQKKLELDTIVDSFAVAVTFVGGVSKWTKDILVYIFKEITNNYRLQSVGQKML